MSSHKAIVRKYVEGVCGGDKEQVLSCVTEDVHWEVFGHARAKGKAELEGVMNSDVTLGPPTHTIDRLFEDGDSVVVNGSGGVDMKAGGRMEFLFCDIFTFSGDLISSVECYQIIVSGDSPWAAQS